MIIQTKYLGEQEVATENIWTFEEGIPSFEDEKEFAFMQMSTDAPFYALQSINTPDLTFVVINPFEFNQAYEFKLSDSVIRQLNINDKQDVQVFVILTIAEPFERTTANLQAPIIVNTKTKHAKQVVLIDEKYLTKHLLFQTVSSLSKEG
ncbi:flagellar assembly protein FliW [Bacillus solimangrovi]|uniref:Flagellar assembly factor FliW n=1 Tax=Bacillus solimangrovi TaxID=1305675 RepID=A0A1E5LE04_9BACI|nr:flagellar assembly protein FliW [Bacillus solimangrovi]OEH92294.1 flagellar assembly protein FliW [Bacillus solimangrovi]